MKHSHVAVLHHRSSYPARSRGSTILSMRIVPGEIFAGQVVREDERLDEGDKVHVLADDDELTTLTPEEEAELAERIAAMDRGEFAEYESAETFLRVLRPRRGDCATDVAHSSDG